MMTVMMVNLYIKLRPHIRRAGHYMRGMYSIPMHDSLTKLVKHIHGLMRYSIDYRFRDSCLKLAMDNRTILYLVLTHEPIR